MKKAVIGIVVSEVQADRLVSDLQSAGFSDEDISVLLPSKERTTTTRGDTAYDTTTGTTKFPKETTYKKTTGTLGVEKHTKAPEGGATGAAVGGIIGGSIGLLAGIGALAIPVLPYQGLKALGVLLLMKLRFLSLKAAGLEQSLDQGEICISFWFGAGSLNHKT